MKINRIALKLSVLASIFILGIIAVMGRILYDQSRDAMINTMKVRARFSAKAVTEAIYPKVDQFTLYLTIQQLLKESAVVYAAVMNPQGAYLVHSDQKKIGSRATSAIAAAAMASSKLKVQEYKKDGVDSFDVSVPLYFGAGGRDARRVGTMRLGFTSASIEQALGASRRKLIYVSSVAIGLGILGTILIVGWMMRGLPILADAAREIGKGNLNVKVDLRSKDEVGELAAAFNAMVSGLKERDFIRNTFGRYVSKDIVDGFMSGKLSVELGGERKQVSILMSDIRDFTKLSESLPPEQVVSILNRYFTEMVAVISSYGGTVDKFIGDAILAVFGWPATRPDHSRLAVAAALAMQMRLKALNEVLAKEGKSPLRTGIAITSGIVVAGNIGSQEKMQYTVIGDTVNLASRMEGVNKRFDTQIITHEPVIRAVQGAVEFQDLGLTEIRGKKDPVRLFAVLGLVKK